MNLTNHTYWNLAGDGTRDILGHVVTLESGAIVPVDSTLIPTGTLMPVAGTPFDFRTPTAVGARIEDPHQQIKFGRGYDHTFVLDGARQAGVAHAARVTEPTTGRTLDIHTTEPGVQVYSGNFLEGRRSESAGAPTAIGTASPSRRTIIPTRRTSPASRRRSCGPARRIGREQCLSSG